MRVSISGVLDWRGVWVHLSGLSRAANAAGLTTHSVVSNESRIWEFNAPEQALVLMKHFEKAKRDGSCRFSVQSNVNGTHENWDVQFQRIGNARLIHVHAIESRPNHRISAQDVRVLSWLANGLQPSAIARRLKQKTNSVQHRLVRLRKRLNAATNYELVAIALRLGIID